MYKVGEYVIKVADGVCKIEDILHLDIPDVDKKKLYYLLIPQEDQNARIYIPVDRADDKIRKVISEEEAWKIIKKVPRIKSTWIVNEKLREQKYKEIIQSCNPESLIGLIKDIYMRREKRYEQGKKDTAVDERFFKLAEDNLYSELAFAIGKNKNEICQIIKDTVLQTAE